jgi:inorganic pyrophosphatase
VGVFWMTDEKGPDAKIICVPAGDPRWDPVASIHDVPDLLLAEIAHFFDVYKMLEPGKRAETGGYDGIESAWTEIEESRARYRA